MTSYMAFKRTLEEQRLVSRQKILDTVINSVIDSLKSKMNRVAEEGLGFGYIHIEEHIDEWYKLLPFSSYLKTQVTKPQRRKGMWNWWGWKRTDEKEYIYQWILQEIKAKFLFRGITIQLAKKHEKYIFFWF